MECPACPVCGEPASRVRYRAEAGYHLLELGCGNEEGCDFEGLVERLKIGWRKRLFFTRLSLTMEEVAAQALDAGIAELCALEEDKKREERKKRARENEFSREDLICHEEMPTANSSLSSSE